MTDLRNYFGGIPQGEWNYVSVSDSGRLDVTTFDWHDAAVDFRTVLGERIGAARRSQRYSVKSASAAAKMSRETWAKIEKGRSVHDTNLQAALDLLGLDERGRPVSPGGEVDKVERLRQAIVALEPGQERNLLVATFMTLFGFDPFDPATPPTTPTGGSTRAEELGA